MKTKDALALKRLAEILSENVLGILGEYHFFAIFNTHTDGESLEAYYIFRNLWQYFGGGELAENRDDMVLVIEDVTAVIRNVETEKKRVLRHCARLKRFITGLVNGISSSTDGTKLKNSLNRATNNRRIYKIFYRNIFEFLEVLKALAVVDSQWYKSKFLFRKSVGEKLRATRLNAQMTQEETAKKLKVLRVTLSTYEQGTREPPLSFLREFALLFNVSIDWVLGLPFSQPPLLDTTNENVAL